MKPLIIFKVGTTFDSLIANMGDFEDWIIRGLGTTSTTVEIIDPRQNVALPEPDRIAGAIITGSHSMVSDREPWSESLAAWIVEAAAIDLPILGICYGHQLLAHALGGEVDYHPLGLEIGTVEIKLSDQAEQDVLFQGLPQCFSAHATHRQTVIKLPENAVVLANNAFEPHHAFRIGQNAWGLQFHPEFNVPAMRSYIQQRCDDPQKTTELLDQVDDTPDASELLRKFACLITA